MLALFPFINTIFTAKTHDCMDDAQGSASVARGHDCRDAGGRVTQEQLPRMPIATAGVSSLLKNP